MTAPVSTTPGAGAVRKTLTFTHIGTADATFPLGPTFNNAVTLVKATIVAVGAGSSPVSTYRLQSQVPGASATSLTGVITPTYAATSVATDMPFTSAALQEVAAGAHLVILYDYTSGTMPPVSVTVEYFDFDGHSV